MRHATRSQRLSLPTAHRAAVLDNLVKSLVTHDQIRTTHAKAKEAQRLADRLVTLGKDGSLDARRRAYRILQNRTLVRRLFVEVAPRFVDVSGGYTRVVRLGWRPGDGAQESLLAFTRVPAAKPATPGKARPQTPEPKTPPPGAPKAAEEKKKPKGLLEGLRGLWHRRKQDPAAA